MAAVTAGKTTGKGACLGHARESGIQNDDTALDAALSRGAKAGAPAQAALASLLFSIAKA